VAHGLIDFLRQQLDADERVALAAPGGVYLGDYASQAECDYAMAFDPARVLAEVKAKRAIVAGYEASYRQSDDYPGWEGAVYAIAQPFADRPG
jgi:hypothetical protein